MKKLTFLFLFAIVIHLISFCQTNNPGDTLVESDKIVGLTDRKIIQQGEFGDHFSSEYAAYNPSQMDLIKLKNEIYNTKIKIVMATWCHDSQIQVPRFYKILDQLDYKINQIELICVDRNKRGGPTDISSLDINFVPTFIFFRNGEELGRIIESPEKSLEKDAYLILSE